MERYSFGLLFCALQRTQTNFQGRATYSAITLLQRQHRGCWSTRGGAFVFGL
jgi:hypothetical protein